MTQVFTAFPYLLAWVAYCAAFAVMAYKVFWWQVEVLLAGVGGLVSAALSHAAPDRAFWRRGCSPMRPMPLPAFCSGPCWPGSCGGTSTSLRVAQSSRRVERRRGHSSGRCRGGDGLDSRRLLSRGEQDGRDADQRDSRHGGWAEYCEPGPHGRHRSGRGRPRRAGRGGGRQATAGGARAGVQAIAGLHSGSLSSLKEAARATYAGVQAGAHGQNLGRLTTLMRGADPTHLMGGDGATHPQSTDAGRRASSTIKPMAAHAITHEGGPDDAFSCALPVSLWPELAHPLWRRWCSCASAPTRARP